MENEIWKQCGETDKCFYEVSNMGRVKSITKINKKEKILKGRAQRGYLKVRINHNINIHKLVITAFIGLRPDGMQIDHIDRNRQNNRLENLRYCTPYENRMNQNDIDLNVERFICDCGSNIKKTQKTNHKSSNKHKKYLQSLL